MMAPRQNNFAAALAGNPEICKGDVAVFQVEETDDKDDDGGQDT